MDLLNTLIGLIGALASFGPVGKVLAVVVSLAASLAVVASSIVALWHALVAVSAALALLPYVGGSFSKAAAFLKAEESTVDDFVNNKLIAILNRLSAIPLPQKPAAPVSQPPQP